MSITKNIFCALTLTLILGACDNKPTTDTPPSTSTDTPATVSTTPTPKPEPANVATAKLGLFSIEDCSPVLEEGMGCSCSFTTKEGSLSYVFVTDTEETACVKIDDKLITVKGGDVDKRTEMVGSPAEFYPLYLRFSGEGYQVEVMGDVIGEYDGGDPRYKGKVELKKGGELIDTQEVWGDCGC